MLEVNYTTTLDDYVAFGLHTLKRSPSMMWRFALGWGLLPLCLMIWAAVVLANGDIAVALLITAGGIAYAVVYPLFHHVWVGQTVRAYAQDLGARGIIGRITLILTDESLTERTETVQSVARWRDMKGVEVVGDCTYIYVTGLLAAIIPRYGFARDSDYEAVRDFAVDKLGTRT